MLRTRALLPIGIVGVCGWLMGAGPAAAQEASLEQIEEARQTYQLGVGQFRAHHYAEAEAAFRRVHRQLRSPGTLFDIALCQEKQRRYADAAEGFARFLRESPRPADRPRLEAHIAALRRRASGQAAPPTTGRVAAAAAGLADEPALGSGEVGSVALPAAAEPPPAPAPASSGRSRWWVWTLVGGGVALIAVGVGLGLSGAFSPAAPAAPTWDVGPGLSSALVRF